MVIVAWIVDPFAMKTAVDNILQELLIKLKNKIEAHASFK